MADAFTVNLNLTKPEVGASSATWGTKLNTDLDVVDSLFSAASTVAYSMKIGAANTLTVAGLVTGTGTINLLSAVVSVGDANFSLKDTGDSTRIVKFELGGLTTSTTRTITFPDADITLVGAANTQTLTNKTLTNAVVGTQTASDNSTKAASTAYVDTAISVGIPAGVYLPYGGAACPLAGCSATGRPSRGQPTPPYSRQSLQLMAWVMAPPHSMFPTCVAVPQSASTTWAAPLPAA